MKLMRLMRVLLDTNVWLDAYDGNRLGSKRANELIDRCEKAGVELLYAAESVKDVYYLISASLKRWARKDGGALSESQAKAVSTYAFACVANMDEIATAVGMDSSDLWLAQKYQAIHPDFEDNLVLAAARRARVDCLVTNDDALLRHAPVAALSVDDALALMETP